MITVLGSINLDLVATASRLPHPGETVSGSGFSTAAGGKGANQAVAVLRAGAPLRLAGAVGDDAFAPQALAELEKDGADLSGVARLDGATGIAMILVDPAGENVIVVVPGANGRVDATMAQQAVGAMAESDILVMQQEIPPESIAAAFDAAAAKGVRTVFNTAPIIEGTAELAARADVLVANETEFALVTGRDVAGDALIAAAAERARAGKQTVVVTLGGAGVVAATPEGQTLWVAAPKITPVDTVGAGDTFCGYLAAALDAGHDLETALTRAATGGSLACLKPGAQPAIPYRTEVDAALR